MSRVKDYTNIMKKHVLDKVPAEELESTWITWTELEN